MYETVNYEFAWDIFESTGNIESYLLYNEYKNIRMGKVTDENDTDHGAGAQNSKYE